MRQLRLAPGALADIRRILKRSKDAFGAEASSRYRALVDQALRDLAEEPGRVGTKPIPDVRPGYFLYHLRWSRPRVAGPPVGRPRHLLLFMMDDAGAVVVAAVVHEREMLERHLDR